MPIRFSVSFKLDYLRTTAMVGRGHGMDAVRLVERIGPCGKLASNGRGYSLIKGRGNEKQIKKQKRGHHRGPDHTV